MTSPLLSDAGRAGRRFSIADDGEFTEHRIRHDTVPRGSSSYGCWCYYQDQKAELQQQPPRDQQARHGITATL
jgi:hypothetical protein